MTDDTTPDGLSVILPRGLAAFRRLLRTIGNIELTLAVIALVVVILLSAAQTFLRYTFSASLWWAQEIAENTIMIAYFFGVSYVFKARQYIVIEFVNNIAPMRVQMVFYLVAQILAFIFCIALLWLVYLFSPTLFNMTTPVLKLPAYITPLPLIVASAMIALTSIYYLAYAVWAMAAGSTGSSLYEMEAAALIHDPWEEEG